MKPPTVAVLGDAADSTSLRAVLDGLRVVCTPSIDALDVRDRESVVALVVRSGPTVNGEQIDTLPALRHVVRPGSGTDNIDAASLRAKGITLHRNGTANASAVGEWLKIATLALLRRIPLGHNGLQAGTYLKTECVGEPLAVKRVAIWGGGAVGLAAFQALSGARDIRFAEWPSLAAGLPRTSAARLADEADIHVVALPLRPETRAYVDEAFLAAATHRTPMIVCAGRLETVDLNACLHALESDGLGGLAIDAIDPRHLPSITAVTAARPLNLLLSPHLGAQRDDVRAQLDRWVEQTLKRALGRDVP